MAGSRLDIDRHELDEGAHVRMREARVEPILEKHDRRITMLERLAWIITGMGIAVGSLLASVYVTNHLKP